MADSMQTGSSVKTQDTLKAEAAAYALHHFIRSGMVVGLGGGSTAAMFIAALGRSLRDGLLRDIAGIPSADSVGQFARRQGIPLLDLARNTEIDVCVDGADEVDPDLNAIKGGGGFLTREKIVAQASDRLVIIVDEAKHSSRLGSNWALPVEVLSFGLEQQYRFLKEQGARTVTLRRTAECVPYRTDQGHVILDADFGPLAHPARLAAVLSARAGIVEHGLFIGMATDLITAGADSGVVHRRRT